VPSRCKDTTELTDAPVCRESLFAPPRHVNTERAGVQPRVFQEVFLCSLFKRTNDLLLLASKKLLASSWICENLDLPERHAKNRSNR
jgi:hypothetical protein